MSAVDKKLIIDTVSRAPVWAKSGMSDGLRDRKGFSSADAYWRRTFKLVAILAIIIAHHAGDTTQHTDISYKVIRRQRRQLAKHQIATRSEYVDAESDDEGGGATEGTATSKKSKAAPKAKVKKKTRTDPKKINLTEEDFDDDVEYISTDALEEREFAWDIIVATLVFEGVVYNWIQKFKNPGKKGPQPWSCILALSKHFRQDRNVENGEEARDLYQSYRLVAPFGMEHYINQMSVLLEDYHYQVGDEGPLDITSVWRDLKTGMRKGAYWGLLENEIRWIDSNFAYETISEAEFGPATTKLINLWIKWEKEGKVPVGAPPGAISLPTSGDIALGAVFGSTPQQYLPVTPSADFAGAADSRYSAPAQQSKSRGTGRQQSKPRVPCPVCHKPGHTEDNCFVKYPAKKIAMDKLPCTFRCKSDVPGQKWKKCGVIHPGGRQTCPHLLAAKKAQASGQVGLAVQFNLEEDQFDWDGDGFDEEDGDQMLIFEFPDAIDQFP